MMNHIKIILVTLGFLFSGLSVFSKGDNNIFSKEVEVKYTPVKNQGSTGTCWSFATTSFIESELMRMGRQEYDLSEMYFVAQAYLNKIQQYLLFHGNNSFSEGGVAHDVMNVVRQWGIVPDTVYPGILIDGKFQHHEFVKDFKNEVDKTNTKTKGFDLKKTRTFEEIIEQNIGKMPKIFQYEGEKFNAESFKNFLGFNPDDYIEITSFTHHPFYIPFVLEIPDNWSHGFYYNLPLDELLEVMFYALNKGYSIAWDGDTSEKTISNSKGEGDLPDSEIGRVTQELRQEQFFERKTTDDHLMHIVGLAKNQEGRTFFITKNSWGRTSNRFDGMINLSEDYVRLKTISIMVHKKAIPENIAKKINLL